MKSFRNEVENPVVENDILELDRKIFEFKAEKLDEEKFRSLRLANGVYGHRQQGVQMVRIKIPYGKCSAKQLRRIAEVSDEYSNGNLKIAISTNGKSPTLAKRLRQWLEAFYQRKLMHYSINFMSIAIS
jgi:dissimilatory sulfite reductase (desulfoviridin) alpha/beta subunit